MPNSPTTVRCPQCSELVTVDPDWRLAICPKCGGVITRMADDASYD
jgi:Zn finger protein HypA/HybF involved in hydrogenase expression